MSWFRNPFASPPPMSLAIVPKGNVHISRSAVSRAREKADGIRFPLQAPRLPAGVIPKDSKTEIIGMDANMTAFDFARVYIGATIEGFPGYPYLASLALRAEYRAMAAALSTELTREWITLNSSDTAGEGTKKKVTEITQEMTRLGIQQIIQLVAEYDCFFGRGQIIVDIKGQDKELPLLLDKRTIKTKSLAGFRAVEPMWTTPSAYNAIDPSAPDFYKPSKWFMMGQAVHASRLLTVITRPVPDLFKPAFNFSGISLSQLAEPYVDNWLRTRQSVSDLINNFSTTVLATRMDQVLSAPEGGESDASNGADLMARADLFTLLRSNKGVMLLDKETEEVVQINTPLGGLHELQAQSQEQMCAVSKIPAVVLTGISPNGMNASSEGEIHVFHNWIAAMQEAFYRDPIDTMIKIIQLSLYGAIDPDITFTFNPMYQMTPKELADIRNTNATAAGAYIDRGVIDPQEERERLARDPESGYQGLDVDAEIVNPQEEEDTDNEE